MTRSNVLPLVHAVSLDLSGKTLSYPTFLHHPSTMNFPDVLHVHALVVDGAMNPLHSTKKLGLGGELHLDHLGFDGAASFESRGHIQSSTFVAKG